MSKSIREQMDELGNKMIINPKMKSKDIQANTLGILSSMYDESSRRHKEMSTCIQAVDFKMRIIVWIGGIIAGAIILNIMGNIFAIPEIKSFGEGNQASQTELIDK